MKVIHIPLCVSFILLVTIALSVGCRKASGPIGPPVVDTDYFPNSVGTRWVYQVDDSAAVRQYDLVIEIVDSIRIDSMNFAKLWLIYEPGGVDTVKRYFAVVHDTVREYFYSAVWWYEAKYVLPLTVGSGWPNPCGGTVVVSREDIIVEAGSFLNTYVVHRRYGCLNLYEVERNWVYPNVGVVKSHYKCGGFCYDNKVLSLKEYNIP
jgi:hypothetical protein